MVFSSGGLRKPPGDAPWRNNGNESSNRLDLLRLCGFQESQLGLNQTRSNHNINFLLTPYVLYGYTTQRKVRKVPIKLLRMCLSRGRLDLVLFNLHPANRAIANELKKLSDIGPTENAL